MLHQFTNVSKSDTTSEESRCGKTGVSTDQVIHPVRTLGLLALVRFFRRWLDVDDPVGDGLPDGMMEELGLSAMMVWVKSRRTVAYEYESYRVVFLEQREACL